MILCTQSGKLLPLEVVEDKILTEPIDLVKEKVIEAFDTMLDKPVDVHFDIINLDSDKVMNEEEKKKEIYDATRKMRGGVLNKQGRYNYHYWEGIVERIDTAHKPFERYVYYIDSEELKNSHQPHLNLTGFLGQDHVLFKRDMPKIGDKVRLRFRILKNEIPSYENSKVIEVIERANL